jgi:O-antigen/teichoic acid export membrane protein
MDLERLNRSRTRRANALLFLGALRNGSTGSMAIAQTFVVRLLVLAINLATGILTARLLGPAGRAEQAAMVIGITIIPFVLSFGLPMAIQYTLRAEPARQDRLVSAATILSIAFGVLSACASLIVLPRLIVQYSPSVLHFSQLFMLVAPFTILYTVFCGVLQARNQFAEVNFTRSVMPIATLCALLALIVAHDVTPLTSSIAYVAPWVLITPWLWSKVRPTLTMADFGNSARWLLDYGSRSYVTDILGTLAAQVDQVLVIGMLSPHSMGIYAVAISAARVSDIFSGPIVLVLFPKAAALPVRQIVDLTARVTRLTIVLLGVSLAAGVATLPFLIPIFFGRSYGAAVPIAQILVLNFVLGGITYVSSQAFMAAGKPGIIAIMHIFGLATTIPAMLLLVPHIGLAGAAWALVISNSVRFIITLTCFPVVLKVRVPPLVPTREDFLFLWTSLRARTSRDVQLPESA